MSLLKKIVVLSKNNFLFLCLLLRKSTFCYTTAAPLWVIAKYKQIEPAATEYRMANTLIHVYYYFMELFITQKKLFASDDISSSFLFFQLELPSLCVQFLLLLWKEGKEEIFIEFGSWRILETLQQVALSLTKYLQALLREASVVVLAKK